MANIGGLSAALRSLGERRRRDALRRRLQNKQERKDLIQLQSLKEAAARRAEQDVRNKVKARQSLRASELAEAREFRSRENAAVGRLKEESRVKREARGDTIFGQQQEDRDRETAADKLSVKLAEGRRRREAAGRKTAGIGRAASLQNTFLPAGFPTPEERQGELALQQLLSNFDGRLREGDAQQLFEASSAGRRTTIPDSTVQALSDETGLNQFEIANVRPEGQRERQLALINRIIAQSSKEKEIDALAAQFGGSSGGNTELESARLTGLISPEFQQDPDILALIKRLKLAKALGNINLSPR